MTYSNGKILKTDTGDRLINASVDQVKLSVERHDHRQTDSSIASPRVTDDTPEHPSPDSVMQTLNQFLPAANVEGLQDAFAAEEFVVRSVKPHEERARQKDFMDAKQAEVDGLNRRVIWELVRGCDVPSDTVIIGGRFDPTLKNVGAPAEKVKVRFINQGYNDRDKPFTVHDTATLHASLIRNILSAASHYEFRMLSHDVSQTYLRNKQKLTRKIYIRSKEDDLSTFNIQKGDFLRLKKPLYGICDAEDYWGITMNSHLINDIGTAPVIGEDALYVKQDGHRMVGICGAYGDDVLNAGGAKLRSSHSKR